MGRRRRADAGSPRLVACGRISGGISETYIAFRAMPSADEICNIAVRKVRRAIGARDIHHGKMAVITEARKGKIRQQDVTYPRGVSDTNADKEDVTYSGGVSDRGK